MPGFFKRVVVAANLRLACVGASFTHGELAFSIRLHVHRGLDDLRLREGACDLMRAQHGELAHIFTALTDLDEAALRRCGGVCGDSHAQRVSASGPLLAGLDVGLAIGQIEHEPRPLVACWQLLVVLVVGEELVVEILFDKGLLRIFETKLHGRGRAFDLLPVEVKEQR